MYQSGYRIVSTRDGKRGQTTYGEWEVINDRSGKVEKLFIAEDAKEQAAEYAKKKGFSAEEIQWDRLNAIRKNYKGRC